MSSSLSPKFTRNFRIYTNKLSRSVKYDLGVRELLPEWASFFTFNNLKSDLIAGIAVACIAVPLSLAIALASGVNPEVGLVSAIVGGIIVALFGGTPLAVSGPAAAMAVLIAATVQKFNLGGLLIIGVICGLLQIFTGVFRLGRFIKYVPTPVVAGFTAGIGAIIFIGQIPRALGLPAPAESKVASVLLHIVDVIHMSHMGAFTLSFATVVIFFGLPKITKHLPAPLFAVVVCSILAKVFKLDVQTIGEIPNHLPIPQLPELPSQGLFTLISASIVVYALASLETLLSSSALDKLSKGKRHNADQELVGQGLGNIAVALFGGIPITGVIARSALNVQAGARTRRSAIIHCMFLLGAIYLFSTLISEIPIAVLAGILLAVAIRMLNPHELIELWNSSRIDAFVYVLTFITIVSVDLIAGVQIGLIATLIIAAIRLGQMKSQIGLIGGDGPSRISIDGPLTFLATTKIELIRSRIFKHELPKGIIFDLTRVNAFDASGAGLFSDMLNELIDKKIRVAMRVSNPKLQQAITSLDRSNRLAKLIADSESSAIRLMASEDLQHPLSDLILGVENYRNHVKPSYQPVLDRLVLGQSPRILFITCSDSRINPNLITGADPGELFIIRNVGNNIPAFGNDHTPAEGAAVEFAVGILQVQDIIVCGHSGCGAMQALIEERADNPKFSSKLTCLAQWLRDLEPLKQRLPQNASAENASEMNVIYQIERLKTYPIVKEALEQKKLRIHAWFYDIKTADIKEWNRNLDKYVDLSLHSHTSM